MMRKNVMRIGNRLFIWIPGIIFCLYRRLNFLFHFIFDRAGSLCHYELCLIGVENFTASNTDVLFYIHSLKITMTDSDYPKAISQFKEPIKIKHDDFQMPMFYFTIYFVLKVQKSVLVRRDENLS